MSGGSYVIAGPEVDMAELDAVSSAPPLAVDLNLNLGPAFALELALGGQEFGATVPISRPSWPRFEPGILAGVQEDEGPAMTEDPNLILSVAEDQHGSAPDARGFHPAISRSTFRGEIARGHVDHDEGDGSSQGLFQPFRNTRPMRHPRRARQVVFAPLPNLAQPQDSSDHGSTTESRALGVGDSASVILPRNGSEWTPNTFLETTPTHQANQDANRKESSEGGKTTEVGPLGAHFECNICLEMASEPVITCCGHLFCWPCLYQWLHLHAIRKECPVCKGFLSDAAITPIYGRGSSEGTEKATGNIPPRPHAHRINGKRQWQDRFPFDGLNAATPTGAGTSDAQADRNEPEASNTAELVLNRFRVAQRLQREYMFQRFRSRLRQRLIGRHAASGPSSALGATASSPSEHSPDQYHHENLLTWMALPLPTADSVSAIGASMDGLRENLETMQRTLEIVSARSTQIDISSIGEGVDAGRTADEERVPPQETELPSPRHSTNVDLGIETRCLSQTSQTASHRALNEASSSFDAEPGSLHARKRRRLN